MAYDYDVVIIGIGSAGMIAGEVAVKLGAKTALVERRRIGGDCLWTGCVPSKALLASAKVAHTMRYADRYGLPPCRDPLDTAPVWERLRAIQRDIAETDDNAKKYEDVGADVLWGEAAFAGDHRIRIGEREITTRYALVCTGSRPAAPSLDGLADVGYLTSENVFELERAPASVLVVGGGPIGCELSQAMNRLGVRVTLLQRAGRILERDEPDLSGILLKRMRDEGVDIELNSELVRAETAPGGKTIHGKTHGEERTWTADEILVAAGRTPNLEGLGLDRAGVGTGPRGILVNDKLQTSARWVYAAGDCAGRYLFTHSAAAEAVVALRNMFFPGSSPAPSLIPWTTFTDPELAHVGLTFDEAAKEYGTGNVRRYEWDLSHSDRARAEGATEGRVVVITDAKFRVLGAHVLSPAAGEMIAQFTLAIERKMRLTPDLGNLVQVYPTYSTAVSQAAAEATYGQLERPFLRMLRRINGVFSR